MSETELNTPLERRPACDNCKTRKTKCDRRLPCASCVTLKVTCRTTGRSSEKRQRVVLSSKYEDAVQDVSRQLADVKNMLQTLVISREAAAGPPPSVGGTSAHAGHTPRAMIDEEVPVLSSVQDGYNGDSSFQSHAHRVKSALEATLAACDLVDVEVPAALCSQQVQDLLQSADAPDALPDRPGPKTPLKDGTCDSGSLPLPPIEVVLRLLRHTKVDKQRFFLDVPFFDEDGFIDICRGVYFATEPISLWNWINVNVGLYFLFLESSEDTCGRIGTTIETIRSHSKVLMANAEEALQSLRLCSEPSAASCKALALLGTFYVKQGHSTIAWRLISSAARACLDLGFHRLPANVDTADAAHHRLIFWFVYAWEKGLAITCGRTSVIHQYDVTTPGPSQMFQHGSIPMRLYSAFLDYAIITGEIQQTLFSASAQHTEQAIRVQQAENFATRLKVIQQTVRSINQESTPFKRMTGVVGMMLDIMMYSLTTLVYRIIPAQPVQAHPLQCTEECVNAARMALSKLVEIGRPILQVNRVGWGMLLNVILSLVPFVSFIVLAGNAIATASREDLTLLSSVLSVLAPTAADYPATRKMHDACARFSRIASLIVSSRNEASKGSSYTSNNEVGYADQAHVGLASNGPVDQANTSILDVDPGFPMAQQDWDVFMNGFETELGDYDPRTLTNITYFGNGSW